MSLSRRCLVPALAAGLMLSVAPAANGQAPLTGIEGPNGAVVSANAINNSGTVAGTVGADPRAFRWNGTMQMLAPLPGDVFGFGFDINDAGAVVGESYGGRPNQTLAVGWAPGSVAAQPAGTPVAPCAGCPPQLRALAINAQGTIVGDAHTGLGRRSAVVFTGGAPTEVAEGSAVDINDAGTLVTSGGVLTGPSRTALITCLEPTAINFSDTVAGNIRPGDGTLVPMRLLGGGCERLPLPAGATGGDAQAINKSGDIAGSVSFGRTDHAAVWPRGEGVQLVRDQVRTPAGRQFLSVADINDRGQLAVVAGPAGGRGGGPDPTIIGSYRVTPAEEPELTLRPLQTLKPAVRVGVRCSSACNAKITGSVVVGGRKAPTRTTRRNLPAGKPRTLKVSLGKKAGRLARRGLSRNRKVRLDLKVTTRDSAGRTRITRPASIRLKRR